MIGVAPRADSDLVAKTDVLRASCDELALKADLQGAEIKKLRNALEQLKADHSAHITTTISRMADIDVEINDVLAEKSRTDRRTAEALKNVEVIRRELVQLGAKLAKEFILLPPAVSRYPRLDKAQLKSTMTTAASSPSSSPESGGGSGGKWYTDEQPASNLYMVDMCIASAVAALDGRISDTEFQEELTAARTDPDSVWSKESLIKSVAASSPMKRRRASLLMLSQASGELSKQSATFDDLTRGPERWTEAERLVAIKATQTHDGMIREAVKELCKVAPVPRQAERQLLTALNMHTMSTAPRAPASVTVMDPAAAAAADGTTTAMIPTSPRSPKGSSSPSSRSTRRQYFNVGHLSLPVDALAQDAVAYATGTKGGASVSGRDPKLRELQAELEEEQTAMSLRTHGARVRAWQELDLKRMGRQRQDPDEATLLKSAAAPGGSLAAMSPKKRDSVTPASVFSMVMNSAANMLHPVIDHGTQQHHQQQQLSTPPRATPIRDHDDNDGKGCYSSTKKTLLHSPSDTKLRWSPSQPQQQQGVSISSEEIALSPVHRSTGMILRDKYTIVAPPPPPPVAVDDDDVIPRPSSSSSPPKRQGDEQESTARQLIRPRPPAPAGIPDPETATAAITMRRTGALHAPQLSFHSSRLDSAAKRLGVERPPSSGNTRFHWKLKQHQQPATIVSATEEGGHHQSIVSADVD